MSIELAQKIYDRLRQVVTSLPEITLQEHKNRETFSEYIASVPFSDVFNSLFEDISIRVGIYEHDDIKHWHFATVEWLVGTVGSYDCKVVSISSCEVTEHETILFYSRGYNHD